MQNPAPHRAENDDAGHVQRPRSEIVFAHLRCAHRVEKELKVPACARQSRKDVITEDGNSKVQRRAAGSSLTQPMVAAAAAAVVRMLLTDMRREVLVAT